MKKAKQELFKTKQQEVKTNLTEQNKQIKTNIVTKGKEPTEFKVNDLGTDFYQKKNPNDGLEKQEKVKRFGKYVRDAYKPTISAKKAAELEQALADKTQPMARGDPHLPS